MSGKCFFFLLVKLCLGRCTTLKFLYFFEENVSHRIRLQDDKMT